MQRFTSHPLHVTPRYGRPTALWLFACCLMVGVMVVLGGLTRLTHSGLSMVEWNPLSLLPPLNDADWQAALQAYQATPEYRLVNTGLSLEGFKDIFWLEYIHRLWGRIIGFCFAVPLLWLIVRRRLDVRLAGRLTVIFLLGGMQGLMGWLMVRSGLDDVPSVSHYRLAAHLLLAFAIMAALLWTALDLWQPARPQIRRQALFWPVLGFGLLLLVTMSWGAFVAGLGAGHIYNSFPLMNGALFPELSSAEHPLPMNFIADPGTVQFTHRLLAAATVLYASLLWLCGRSRDIGWILPALAGWTWLQASLGVSALLLDVPAALGIAHQGGAMVLFGLTVILLHRLRGSREAILR